MSKTIVITGASDGVGASAAAQLSAKGHQVVVVGRSPDKTKNVAQAIGAKWHVCDFASFKQVRALAETLSRAYPRIDVLANNAGGLFNEHRLTVDGNDMTLQVNHLSPFLLTNLMIETLVASGAAVIQTSSQVARRFAHLELDNLQNKRNFDPIKAYSDAKLCNILFTRELHRRYGARGLAAVCFHPGNVASNFGATTKTWWRYLYRTPLRHIVFDTPEKAGGRLTRLADGAPWNDWKLGAYYENDRVSETNPQADDETLASDLWRQSARLVGLAN